MQPAPHNPAPDRPAPISTALLERFEAAVEAADQNIRRWVFAELAGIAAR